MNFIAEVSSNHNRDLSRCFKFIDVAAESGCNSIKFQLFKIEELFSQEILLRSESHRKRKQWELPLEFIPKLAQRCLDVGINFACTPFYLDAVSELLPYVSFYKIASYELLWDELLISCAKTNKPIIISTGMANLKEITHAKNILVENGCRDLTILHCTSSYPTPYYDANLKAIETLRFETKCKIGWSDHTVSPAVIQRAIHKWGAEVIEFHLDIDGNGDEFNSGHCWLPNQISDVIKEVNIALKSDGNGIKEPVACEMADRLWRADPSDGLRPLKQIRGIWKP